VKEAPTRRAIHSSDAPLTVLVMSGDGSRRDDWATVFEGKGLRVIRCAGPEATTCVLTVQHHCPLQDEADFIFYDRASVTSELERNLDAARRPARITYADSVRTPNGREYPVPLRIRRAARG
jgi:hypothetical protein